MKILHLTKKYPKAIGGDSVMVSNLEKLQARSGHEVFILTSNCPDIDDKDNVHKFGLRDRSENQDRITLRRIISLIFMLASGFKYLKKIKPDIIHSHSADLGFFISISAKLYGIPLVNTCHGISFPYIKYGSGKRTAERFFLKYAGFSRIISVDRSNLEHLKNAGIENVVYIPNGVDLEKFHGERKKRNKIRFLFVGRLEKQKGLQYLIEATTLLKDYDFEVFIVGEGSQEEELRKLAEESEVNDLIRFLGRKNGEELVELYLSTNAFILPSTWEGMPLTLLEAWATGLPVITTKVGGIPQICTNEENSLMVEPRNSRELADAMLRIINEKNLGEKLGNNGRKLVEERYSLGEVSRATLKLYHEVLVND